MFATDLHEFTISDGSYVEGARKALAVMVKDSKKYAPTGRRLGLSALGGRRSEESRR
jgi:hypothetical protein